MDISASTISEITSLIPFGSYGLRAKKTISDYPIATLIIGLGQVGWQAASLVNTMIRSTYTPQAQASCQFLAIARNSKTQWNSISRKDCFLFPHESTAWHDIPTAPNYSAARVRDWWPGQCNTDLIEKDRNDIRCYARLMLFSQHEALYEHVGNRVQNLITQSLSKNNDGQRIIFLLGSIAEAESSGLIIDVAWLLRMQVGKYTTPIVALLSTDINVSDDEKKISAQANVYATLKEIDSLMVNAEKYHIGIPIHGKHKITLQARRNFCLFDQIMLTGDDRTDVLKPPTAAALAEMTVTWMEVQGKRGSFPLPVLEAQKTILGRFTGYSTFGVAKIAVPYAKAVEMIATQLANGLLKGMKASQRRSNTYEDQILTWVNAQISDYQSRLNDESVQKEPTVRDYLEHFVAENTEDKLQQSIKSLRKSMPRMKEIADQFIQQLQYEALARNVDALAENADPPDTLNTRVELVFEKLGQELSAQMTDLPSQFICGQGFSLPWAIRAFRELCNKLNEIFQSHLNQTNEAEVALRSALEILKHRASDYDSSSGLLGTKQSKQSSVITAFFDAVQRTIEYIFANNESVAWKCLYETAVQIQTQLTDLAPRLEKYIANTEQHLYELRLAFDTALKKTFVTTSTGVLCDKPWYDEGEKGTRHLFEMTVASSPIIARIFDAWAESKPSNKAQGLLLFIQPSEIIEACQQFVAKGSRFQPLYHFINERRERYLNNHSNVIKALRMTALPRWTVESPLPEARRFEWLRSSTPLVTALLSRDDQTERVLVESPDEDETCLISITQNQTAASFTPVREFYAEAYRQRVNNDIPMHLDGHWEQIMIDLIPTQLHTQINIEWASARNVSSVNERIVSAKGIHLEKLALTFARALLVEANQVTYCVRDHDLCIIDVPIRDRKLRYPPNPCPIAVTYGKHAPAHLANVIARQLTLKENAEKIEGDKFVVLIIVNDDYDTLRLKNLLENLDVVCLILDERGFKSIVGSPRPIVTLIKEIQKIVDLVAISPFQTQGPVPEHMFYGRHDEIRYILSKIKTTSVSLIGGRKIGKTSILQQIVREVKADIQSNNVAIFVDCEPVFNYNEFFYYFCNIPEVKQVVGNKILDPEPQSFTEIVNLLANYYGKVPVFLMDEIDNLMKFDNQDHDRPEHLFRTFRSLSHNHRCQFVFSGERQLYNQLRNAHSRMFNFCERVTLTLLHSSVVQRLLSRPLRELSIWVDDSVINLVYDYSTGHPHIVQLLARGMIEALNFDSLSGQPENLLTDKHFHVAIHNQNIRQEILLTYQGTTGPLAQLLMLSWPTGKTTLTRNEMLKAVQTGAELIDIPNPMFNRAIDELILYHFIRRINKMDLVNLVDGDALAKLVTQEDVYELIPKYYGELVDLTKNRKQQIQELRDTFDEELTR